MQLVSLTLVHWKVRYPVDGAIQRSNKRQAELNSFSYTDYYLQRRLADDPEHDHSFECVDYTIDLWLL